MTVPRSEPAVPDKVRSANAFAHGDRWSPNERGHRNTRACNLVIRRPCGGCGECGGCGLWFAVCGLRLVVGVFFWWAGVCSGGLFLVVFWWLLVVCSGFWWFVLAFGGLWLWLLLFRTHINGARRPCQRITTNLLANPKNRSKPTLHPPSDDLQKVI